MKTVFVFMGKPGSGKGTAREYCMSVCAKQHIPFYFSDTGDCFRKSLRPKWWHRFIPGIFYVNKYMRDTLDTIQSSGKLQSPALAAFMWGAKFFAHYKGESVIFIDGSPRKELERQILESLFGSMAFWIVYIHIDVKDETAITRMEARHKVVPRPETDSREKILKRISEFNTHTNPILLDLSRKIPTEQAAYFHVKNEKESRELKKEIRHILYRCIADLDL